MFRSLISAIVLVMGACAPPDGYGEFTRAMQRPPAKYVGQFKGYRHVERVQPAQVSSACLELHERHFPNTDWRDDWPHHGIMRGCSLTTVEPDDWTDLGGAWSEHCYIILAEGSGEALRQHEDAHCGVDGWPHDHPYE